MHLMEHKPGLEVGIAKANQRNTEATHAGSKKWQHLDTPSILRLQQTAGNSAVVQLLRRQGHLHAGTNDKALVASLGQQKLSGYDVPLTVSRQDEPEDAPQFPPDWQHGAPTKPVPPDPHVHEIPGPGQSPDQGPYRSPGRPTEPQEATTSERIRTALINVGIPAFAVGAIVALVVAALADPEPFSKVALIIGSAAAIAFFILIGRRNAVPPGA
jgi:hypothetical protein